jgi:hypothetical protein
VHVVPQADRPDFAIAKEAGQATEPELLTDRADVVVRFAE